MLAYPPDDATCCGSCGKSDYLNFIRISSGWICSARKGYGMCGAVGITEHLGALDSCHGINDCCISALIHKPKLLLSNRSVSRAAPPWVRAGTVLRGGQCHLFHPCIWMWRKSCAIKIAIIKNGELVVAGIPILTHGKSLEEVFMEVVISQSVRLLKIQL